MKRMHIHIAVADLGESIAFYRAVFGVEPCVVKPDYAKWMLDDPRINLAISARGTAPGLDHLGLQFDSGEELATFKAGIDAAALSALSEEGAVCCYAKSDKHWLQDPSGIAWEAYHTLEGAPTFHGAAAAANPADCCVATETSAAADDACCAPDSVGEGACCAPAPQKVQLIARKNIEAIISKERKNRV